MDGMPSSFPPNNMLSSASYDMNSPLSQVPIQSNSPYPPFPPQAVGSVPPPLIPRSGSSSSVQNNALPLHQHQGTPNPRRKSSSDTSRPVRKRITRACDQCNQLRTKCDGLQPCTHCQDLGLECQYNREQKKRGKASRKDLAERGGKDSEPPTPTHQKKESKDIGRPTVSRKSTAKGKARRSVPSAAGFMPSINGPFPYASPNDREAPRAAATGLGVVGMDDSRPFYAENVMADESGENSADYTGSEQSFSPNAEYFANYHHVSDSFQSRLGSTQRPPTISTQPLQNVFKSPDVADPFPQGWQHPISSSQAPFFQNPFPTSFDNMQPLRYPVLEPVLSYLDQSIVPTGLACELLEFYFTSSSAAYQHPLCPFILAYVVRKRSVLHLVTPRRCQPALLASMLWVAAQTSDASILSSAPSARAQICRHLHQLTMELLKPLVQGASWEMIQTNQSVVGGMHFNSAMDIDAHHGHTGPKQSEGGPLLPSGNAPPVCLDDIIAFIHLATAMSASEYKATSIRWWTVAWALAREMKLGREISDNDPAAHTVTAEHKEERRKVWWLLYMVDRHLALCYNRPFHLLDSECADLQLPMDERSWEMGDFDTSQKPPLRFDPDINQFQCRGHSVFHFFLPLMTILGDIVDMHHEKNHPRLGERFQPAEHWTAKTAQISESLGHYEQGLRAFHRLQRRAAQQARDDYQLQQQKQMQFPGQQMPRVEVDLQTRIILTYGTYIMHVLHVLLAGKWDPISLLEDSDSWISSQSFLEATSHAVSAAEALGEILELDPGLEFMPFFMGIYLLQGSFLLLLIADKLRGEADEEVLKACETIIRAHDACVATLSTDYQRNFSKVMRNTLAVARGRSSEDVGDHHRRRRELLGLYRWTRDGSGLAL